MEGTKSATTVELWIGKNYAMVNVLKNPLTLAALTWCHHRKQPHHDSLRFVVETLGAAITWNDSAKVITITYHKQ